MSLNYYTYDEYKAAVAYGVRKGWIKHPPPASPERTAMSDYAKAELGSVPAGIFEMPRRPGVRFTPASV